jgi:ubiquinol-cytochrome c reductase cytochrome c subunit
MLALLLLAALLVTGFAYAAANPASARAEGTSTGSIDNGKKLFLANCATCHGIHAQGRTGFAPSLIGVGGADVDFQVGTGRMPAARPDVQIQQTEVQFNGQQIADLAAFVASLAPGPAIPDAQYTTPVGGDVAKGGALFLVNCAMCHNFAGSGGALTRGKYAPSLKKTTPRHMYEAMLTGPQSMPVFGDGTMTPDEKREIIGFLKTTSAEPSPGGLALGKIGPVSEGAVGWLVGLGALVACAVWLGAKAR